MVVLKVQGERMSGDCWTLQRGGVFHFPPDRGWPPAHPPGGITLPEKDDTSGYRVWHCPGSESLEGESDDLYWIYQNEAAATFFVYRATRPCYGVEPCYGPSEFGGLPRNPTN